MNLLQIKEQLVFMTESEAEQLAFLGNLNERFVFRSKIAGTGITEPLTEIYSSMNSLDTEDRQTLFTDMNTINYALGGSGRPCR